MDCPACGRTNAPDRLECQYCEALLADVFAESAEPTSDKTDPISRVGLTPSTPPETAYSRPIAATQYTGDLPRLFRFGDRYQILEKLGEGGMGRVYKALDLELDRPVALKTIRAEKGTSPEILSRFKQELVLARKVTHKNVVRIYDLGEAEGMKFFTMELVEGKSLRDELKERGPLPAKEAVAFLKQMLGGLAEAHSQGVVHRDLKPQNVMVDEAGQLRIMDFGIARTAESATLTGTDEMMGTPDYISPEQVKGEHADAQSDLYALGVILYEMLTGDVPFKGDTAISKIVARLQVKPPSPRSLRSDIPAYLERIVLKLMETDKDLRYKSAEAVLQDIEREQVDRSVLLRVRKVVARHRRWVAAATLAASIALAFYEYDKSRADADEPLPAEDVVTLAVLPFDNMARTEDLEWMENGLPELLVTDISQIPKLRPVLPDRVQRILRDLGKDEQRSYDEETLSAVARLADAEHLLYGSFVQSEGQLRLRLSLRESASGVVTPLAALARSDELFSMVDDLTERVSAALDLGEHNRPIVDVTTAELGAFRAYHQGLAELQKGRLQSSIPLFTEAVKIDPKFAMAHARLAEAYFHIGADADARSAIATADALAGELDLPPFERYEIHAISARVNDDPNTAVNSYRELAKLYPNDPDVLFGLASSLETLGQAAESVAAYERVLKVSPDYGAALLGLGRMMVVRGEPGEAIPRLQRAIESGEFDDDKESLGMIHSILGVAYKDMTQYDEAISELDTSLRFRREIGDQRGVTTSLSNLASALRSLKRFDEARENLDEALELARAMDNKTMESLVLLNLGNVLADTGDYEAALSYYLQSLDIEWDRDEITELANRMDAIARVLERMGRYSEALTWLKQARVDLEKAEDVRETAFNRRLTGMTQEARGDYEAATAATLESMRLSQELGAGEDVAAAHLVLASLYADQGRFDEALKAVSAAAEADPSKTEETSRLRAAILVAIGDVDGAREALGSCDTDPGNVVSCATVRARMERLAGEARSAEAILRSAEGSLDLAPRAERLDWELELGRCLAAQGRATDAGVRVEPVYREATDRGMRPLRARAAAVLAAARSMDGRLDEAMQLASESVKLASAYRGRPLLVDANHLLAEIAERLGREASSFRSDAQESAHEMMEMTPESHRSALIRSRPWLEPQKKGS